jgi:hypothetical protein
MVLDDQLVGSWSWCHRLAGQLPSAERFISRWRRIGPITDKAREHRFFNSSRQKHALRGGLQPNGIGLSKDGRDAHCKSGYTPLDACAGKMVGSWPELKGVPLRWEQESNQFTSSEWMASLAGGLFTRVTVRQRFTYASCVAGWALVGLNRVRPASALVFNRAPVLDRKAY